MIKTFPISIYASYDEPRKDVLPSFVCWKKLNTWFWMPINKVPIGYTAYHPIEIEKYNWEMVPSYIWWQATAKQTVLYSLPTNPAKVHLCTFCEHYVKMLCMNCSRYTPVCVFRSEACL